MPICYLEETASAQQIAEMLETLETYIKFAVDIRRGVAAGGGELHADCESVLLQHSCRQEDIWGADFLPDTDEIRCEALINLMPSRNNPSMLIRDPEIRREVETILRSLLPEKAQ